MARPQVVLVTVATLCSTSAPVASAQPRTASVQDSVTVVPGERYAAGSLHRLLFGSDCRSVWTTPLRVELLDLETFEGGVTPIRRGGGMQTASLRFATQDGRQFQFRSIDKDPSAIIPEELRETLVADIVQDQISSAHPVGALVVSPILDAVGVLHAEPHLVVLPDEPALGPFREEFANRLGFIEERPDENDNDLASFHGAVGVVGTPRMIEGVEEDLETFDARAFLAARLTDLFLGDWDRHADQWRWARFGEGREYAWNPIPRDRDQAFVRMDGWLLILTRQYFPQFVNFGSDYPPMIGQTWNGRDLDRRFLAELEWPVWDSVASVIHGQITDEVIDGAVDRLPPELDPEHGAVLRRRLRNRRDGLADAARGFYELLASEVDVHTTDEDEVAEVLRLPGGELEVLVRAVDTRYGPVEIFSRRFAPGETHEIRLFMHGGDDSVHVEGEGGGMGVRVVGGQGADRFIDRAGGAHFYDEGTASVFVRASGTTVDDRDFDEPPPSPSPLARDWGSHYRFPLMVGFSPDVGLLTGATLERYDFGFRMLPYASSLRLGAAWGWKAKTVRATGELRLQRENSGLHWILAGIGSGLKIVRFHGFGKTTELSEAREDYEVETQQYALESKGVLPISSGVTVAVGPAVQLTRTVQPPAFLGSDPLPYGMDGDFGQAGLRAALVADGRNRARSATRGAMIAVEGEVVPALWDVEETFAIVQGHATAYLTPGSEFRPTLALRVGAQKTFGAYPYHEAAYLGGASTVRLGTEQRFAGDDSAYGSAELRLRLGRAVIVLPVDVGVFGLADAGRVWLDGEESDTWHTAFGVACGWHSSSPRPPSHSRSRGATCATAST